MYWIIINYKCLVKFPSFSSVPNKECVNEAISKRRKVKGHQFIPMNS